jgi:ABC-2 type transport system ATP-binding protein
MYEKRYPVAVEAEGLRKRFGATEAVRGLDLTVAAGSIYGLLGPNGAGKTTTVKILATLLRPDGGRAAVLGHDVARDAAAVRRKIALAGHPAAGQVGWVLLAAAALLAVFAPLTGYFYTRRA